MWREEDWVQSEDQTSELGNWETGARRLLGRLGVELRPDEWRPCLHLFILHFLLLTFQYVCKAVRQATFLDALGAERLPWVYLLVAVCSYPLLRTYGRLTDVSKARTMRWAALGIAGSLVVFRLMFDASSGLFGLTFYVWISLVSAFLVSLFWSKAGEFLDPRQARRLFGFLGAGGLLGGMAGGQAARLVSHFGQTADALLVAAGVLVLAALAVRSTPGAAAGKPPGPRTVDGVSLAKQSPYLRRIAWAVLLSTLVAQVIDLQFSWAIERATSSLDERTGVFGNLYTLTGLAAFLLQWLLTARIHRRFGVGLALRMLPTLSGLGSAGFLLAAFLKPAWLLGMIWSLKIGDNALRYSLDQSTRELLFMPFADAERPRAKAFVDVFVQRLAKGAAALTLLAVPLGWLSVSQTAWISVGGAMLWFLLVNDLKRRYVASFRSGLRDPKPIEDEPVELRELATLELMFERLGSADAREVVQAMDFLVQHGRGRLVPPIMLQHGEAKVRLRALEVLADEKRDDAVPAVEKLLTDEVPEIRASAARVLSVFRSHHLAEDMRARLRDPDACVQAAAVAYLLTHPETAGQDAAEAHLQDMLSDGDPEVRLEAARVLGDLDDEAHQASLVRLLYDADVRVCRQAMRSVARRLEKNGRNPLYVPILVSHLRHRKLKHRARRTLVAYGERVLPALQHFMLEPQEEIWVRRGLPKTIAQIGGPGAVRALSAALDVEDLFLRRKMVEALISLRGRSLDFTVDRGPIDACLNRELSRCQRVWLDLKALAGTSANGGRKGSMGARMLLRLLEDRLASHQQVVVGLLSLIYPLKDMRAIQSALAHTQPAVRLRALEYLDNMLEGEVCRAALTVFDDLPLAERQRQIKRLWGHELERPAEVLERLIFGLSQEDADVAALAAAALCFIHGHGLKSLDPLIGRAVHDERGLLRETAIWLRDSVF